VMEIDVPVTIRVFSAVTLAAVPASGSKSK